MEDTEGSLVGLAIAGRNKIVTIDDDEDLSEFEDTDDHLLAQPPKPDSRPKLVIVNE